MMSTLLVLGQALEPRYAILPKSGDTYQVSTDRSPEPQVIAFRGQSQSWDLSRLQAPFARKHIYEAHGERGLRLRGSDHVELFEVRDQQLYLTGFEDCDPLLMGDKVDLIAYPGLLEYSNPIEYLDASSHYARLIGYTTWGAVPRTYWMDAVGVDDTIRIEMEIFRDDVVDGDGDLQLLYKQYQVKRIRREELRVLHVYTPSDDGWVEQTERFKQMLVGVEWEASDTKYLFIAPDKPRALAEVWVDDIGQVTRVDYLSSGRYSTSLSAVEQVRGLYVYPNPSFGHVRFEVFNVPRGTYHIEIYTILGRKRWSQTIHVPEEEVWTADFTMFNRGTYLYSLIDATGKRLFTRRLVIMKP